MQKLAPASNYSHSQLCSWGSLAYCPWPCIPYWPHIPSYWTSSWCYCLYPQSQTIPLYMFHFIAMEIFDLISNFSLVFPTFTLIVSFTLRAQLHLPIWVIPKILWIHFGLLLFLPTYFLGLKILPLLAIKVFLPLSLILFHNNCPV